MHFDPINHKNIPLWIFLLVVFLTGCSTQNQWMDRTIDVPIPIVIDLSNYLYRIEEAIEECRSEFPELTILTSFGAGINDRIDIQIRFGSADETGNLYLIAEDELVVIQSAMDAADQVTFSNLISLYTGERDHPSGLSLWTYPDGDYMREIFENLVLNGKQFRGEIKIATDPHALAHRIANDSNAIGYVPRSMVIDGLHIIANPGNQPDAFALPVFAEISENANPATEKIISCLQSGSGHKSLLEIFERGD